jgi:CheY-like chemotaxis protein
MSPKRALIVDDSRSARAVLARMLERHQLEVDTAESAEDAIQYLSTHRPDVIFMDHLMPGMDGFQAVQAIKNDPRTATIPIMMYTSQEGEVYVSQARALGAVGVLPKQTRIADVSKALEQLRLIEEGAIPADTRAPAVAAAAGDWPAARLAALPPELRTLIESLLAEHAIELRRFVIERLDNNAERIVGDLRLLMQDGGAPAGAATPAATTATTVTAATSPQPGTASPPQRWLPWLAALAVALLALAVGLLWWRDTVGQRELQAQLAAARTAAAAAEQRALAAALTPVAPSEIAPSGPVLVDPVPYGEAPFAGARVEHVQALLERLAAQGFRGSVQILSFPGRYCLGGSGEGATLAADDTLVAKCEPMSGAQDGAAPATHESVAFADMLAAARRANGGTIDVQLLYGGADEVQQPYPAPSDTLAALQWNRVAAANNRIEVRLVPAASAPSPASP